MNTSPYARPLVPGYLTYDPPHVLMSFGKHVGANLRKPGGWKQ